jgi:hypothetical protein
MKSITTAIENLPEELITPEIVTAAIHEGKAELLNYLPEKYLTEDNINQLVENDKSYWGRFNLERIPASCRNQAVCNCAVNKHINNYRYVPDEQKTPAMLEKVMDSIASSFHLLDAVPAGHWNHAVIYSGIKSLYREQSGNYSKNSYRFYEDRNKSTSSVVKKVQVLLSFVPQTLKNKSFYHGLFVHVVIPVKDIIFLTPNKFKDPEFYLLLARWAFDSVPEEKYSYKVFLNAIQGNSYLNTMFSGKKQAKELFLSVMDDTLADASVMNTPFFFNELPKRFQTPERLLFLIENKSEFSYYDRLIDDHNERILTQSVCKALIERDKSLPKLPDRVWDAELVEHCLNHSGSFRWFEQMPQSFQTQEIVNAATDFHPHLIQYVHPVFIHPHLAMKIFRNEARYKKYLPEKHFTRFGQITGLPDEFFGGETTFWNLKENKPDYSYCQIGNTFIGFYKESRYANAVSYVIRTRIPLESEQPETVFKRKVAGFHKTWLEKMIADYDSGFVKPAVSKALKEVQLNLYCGIEPAGEKDGIELFRITFMDETVGFAGRKNGKILHRESREEVISHFGKDAKEQEAA